MKRTVLERFTSRPFLTSVAAAITAVITMVSVWRMADVSIQQKIDVTIAAITAAGGALAVFTASESYRDGKTAQNVLPPEAPLFDKETIRAFVAQEATRRISDKIAPVNYDEPTQRVLEDDGLDDAEAAAFAAQQIAEQENGVR